MNLFYLHDRVGHYVLSHSIVEFVFISVYVTDALVSFFIFLSVLLEFRNSFLSVLTICLLLWAILFCCSTVGIVESSSTSFILFYYF